MKMTAVAMAKEIAAHIASPPPKGALSTGAMPWRANTSSAPAVTGCSHSCSHSECGIQPSTGVSAIASGTLIQPPTTESTARTASGTHMTGDTSCTWFCSSSDSRDVPWNVMIMRRVM